MCSGCGVYNAPIRGPGHTFAVNFVTAQTSASSRSGEAPGDRPPRPKSHI